MSIPGRRLREYEQNWRRLGANNPLMKRVTTEFHISVRNDRPITLWDPTLRDHTRISRPDHHLIVKKEVRAMLDKGIIRIVTSDLKGFYSKFVLYPKPSVDEDHRWRPCINFDPLNFHVSSPNHSASISRSQMVMFTQCELQPTDWAASIDMTDVNIITLILITKSLLL